MSGYQAQIDDLKKALESSTNAQTQEVGYTTLDDAYAASVVNQAGAAEESVPENGINADPYAISDNRQAWYTNPYDVPRDYNPNDYIYPDEQQKVYTNPYDIPGDQTQSGVPDGTKPFVPTMTEPLPRYGQPENGSNNVGSGYISFDDDVPTMEDIEAEYQEKQKLLEAPLSELTLDELEDRKKIELQLIEDGIDNQKEAELAKISEIWAEQKQLYIDSYNADPNIQIAYMQMYGDATAEQFAEAMLDEWEKQTKQEMYEEFDRKYEDGVKDIDYTFSPYTRIPV